MASAVLLRVPRLSVRIDDSKRLTPRQRAAAFDVILRHASVGFGIVDARHIDSMNILQATLRAMQHAVQDLPERPDVVLVDGPIAPQLELPCWPIVRGDQQSYVIACASIMAKVLRDALMTFYHTLAPQYGFDQHKGYGTALHAQQLKRFGPSLFHRSSVRPVAHAVSRQAIPTPQAGAARVGLVEPPGTCPEPLSPAPRAA